MSTSPTRLLGEVPSGPPLPEQLLSTGQVHDVSSSSYADVLPSLPEGAPALRSQLTAGAPPYTPATSAIDIMVKTVQIVDNLHEGIPAADLCKDGTYHRLHAAKLAHQDTQTRHHNDWNHIHRETATALVYGIDAYGRQVTCHMKNFRPGLWTRVLEPAGTPSTDTLDTLQAYFERRARLPAGSVQWSLRTAKHAMRYEPPLTEPEGHSESCEDESLVEGRHTQRDFDYVWWSFPSAAAFRRIAKLLQRDPVCSLRRHGVLEEVRVAVEEERVEPEQQFFEHFKMKPHEWLKVREVRLLSKHYTVADAEFQCDARNAMRSETSHMAPTLVMSFDIECYGSLGKGFICKATRDKDEVYLIASSFAFVGTLPECMTARGITSGEPFLTVCHSSKPCAPVRGMTTIQTRDEAQLLNEWRDMFAVHMRPDAITGWNIWNFDVPYILRRAMKRNAHRALYQEMLLDQRSEIEFTTKFRLGAKNIAHDNHLRFDMYIWDKSNKKRVYGSKLSSVAKAELGQDKDPVEVKHINRGYESGHPEDVALIAKYCGKDCILALTLMNKMGAFMQYMEEAKIMCTPLPVLAASGQQIRVRNIFLKNAHNRSFVMNGMYNSKYAKKGDYKYDGGTVMDPVPGMYKDPIIILDFASLYPSIMMAYNLCYSTYIASGKNGPPIRRPVTGREGERPLLTPGVRPPRVKQLVSKGVPILAVPCRSGNCHYFVKRTGKWGCEGLLPTIERNLKSDRNECKRRMKAAAKAGNEVDRVRHNCAQKAVKVSMNSFYGATGVSADINPVYGCLPVAESITQIGGESLWKCVDYIREHYPELTVVYGDTDSVMVMAPGLTPAQAIPLGYKLEKELTDLFPPDMIMEFEDLAVRFRALKPKMYKKQCLLAPTLEMARRYMEIGVDSSVVSLTHKGVKNARRDNCSFIRRVFGMMTDEEFSGRDDPDYMLRKLQDMLEELVFDRVPLSDLETTYSLNDPDSYKENPKNLPPPGMTLAWELEKRVQGSSSTVGDRIASLPVKKADPSRILPPDLAPWKDLNFRRTAMTKSSKDYPVLCYLRHPSEITSRAEVDRTFVLRKQFINIAKTRYYPEVAKELDQIVYNACSRIRRYDQSLTGGFFGSTSPPKPLTKYVTVQARPPSPKAQPLTNFFTPAAPPS